jgi:Protein tyrosine phosphatase-like protein, PTPLA
MVLSWSLTGVIRYTFYAASLVGWEFAPLLWARYSTFALYPIGAGSEALVNLATLPISVWFSILPLAQWNASAILRGILFVGWWPGEPPFFFPFSAIFVPAFSPSLTGEGWCATQACIDISVHDQAVP